MIYNEIKILIDQVLKSTGYYQKINYKIERTKHLKFGDFSCNVAIVIANDVGQTPKVIAEKLLSNFPPSPYIEKVSFAFPGFLNFTLSSLAFYELGLRVKKNQEKFGYGQKQNKTYLIELVSANPTGYLHIGHARNGVFGDALGNLLQIAGYQVHREYLINDAGVQVKNLAYAVLVRYLNLQGVAIELPANSYRGHDIIICAKALNEAYGDKYKNVVVENETFKNSLELDFFKKFATHFFLENIKTDLQSYQIKIDEWFSEQKMHETKELEKIFEILKADLYEKDGALWFAASKHLVGNKDEVLIKQDRNTTYYAQDLAYHYKKLHQFTNNFQLVNIFGADHHGHVARLQAFFLALKFKPKKVIFLVTQLVHIIKDGKELKMSKRTGQSLTMREMLELSGYNAMRWFLVSQSINSHVDINLDLIKSTSADNPIYYVLYAYARIWQILNKAENYSFKPEKFDLLTTEFEKQLMNHLHSFEYTIRSAAQTFEPHKICNYLYDLAKLLHIFYNQKKILGIENKELQTQRLNLIFITQQIIFNGLAILRITPQKKM